MRAHSGIKHFILLLLVGYLGIDVSPTSLPQWPTLCFVVIFIIYNTQHTKCYQLLLPYFYFDVIPFKHHIYGLVFNIINSWTHKPGFMGPTNNFIGSPSCSVSYYNYISVWPYYIVIHLPLFYLLLGTLNI